MQFEQEAPLYSCLIYVTIVKQRFDDVLFLTQLYTGQVLPDLFDKTMYRRKDTILRTN